jgi:hypothetical protein
VIGRSNFKPYNIPTLKHKTSVIGKSTFRCKSIPTSKVEAQHFYDRYVQFKMLQYSNIEAQNVPLGLINPLSDLFPVKRDSILKTQYVHLL